MGKEENISDSGADFSKPIEVKKLLDNAILVNFLPCREAMDQLLKGEEYTITLKYQNEQGETISSNHPVVFTDDSERGIGFKITLEVQIVQKAVLSQDSYGLNKSLLLHGKSLNLKTCSRSVIGFSTDFPFVPQTLSGRFSQINKVTDKNYTDSYNRLYLQIPETDFINPHEVLRETGRCVFDYEAFNIHRSIIGLQFRQGESYTDIPLDGSLYRLYSAGKQLYFIDGLQKEDLQIFRKRTNVIRKALALLTGRFFGGDVIFFVADKQDFKTIDGAWYEVEDLPMVSENRIHDSTLFKSFYESNSSEYQESHKHCLGNVTTDVFANLCELLWNDENILYAADLILRAAANRDPVQQGVLYSAALESLTGALGEKKTTSLKPIDDPEIFENIKIEFMKIVESQEISDDAKKIFKARIDNMNSPTNQDKLTQTFVLHSVNLSVQNKKTINERNKYLHGKSPLSRDQEFELRQITMELHSLQLMLLLKVAGYSGHVINLHMQSHLKDETKRLAGEHELLQIIKKAAENFLIAQGKGDQKMLEKIKEEMDNALGKNYLMNIVSIV